MGLYVVGGRLCVQHSDLAYCCKDLLFGLATKQRANSVCLAGHAFVPVSVSQCYFVGSE